MAPSEFEPSHIGRTENSFPSVESGVVQIVSKAGPVGRVYKSGSRPLGHTRGPDGSPSQSGTASTESLKEGSPTPDRRGLFPHR